MAHAHAKPWAWAITRQTTVLLLVLRQNPNIAELQWIAVTLKFDRTGCAHRCGTGSAGFLVQFDVVVNRHAIVLDRQSGGFGDVAVFVRASVGEFHVIGLPNQRREAHVDVRFFDCVHALESIIGMVESSMGGTPLMATDTERPGKLR